MLALWTADALACGGFFCDTVQPVDQAGETIVFDVDEGMVTTHVQVTFEGPAEDFAWVLPVPGVPEVFLSSERLFDELELRTRPTVSLDANPHDRCWPGGRRFTNTATKIGTDFVPPPSVSVLATPSVGPYEGVVLAAASEEALVTWLTDNGFGLPSNFGQVAAGYLANDLNFLALKLAKDAGVGDLPPLGVRWAGERPSVPLTLTAVAARPGMTLAVYVLGEHRAVPLSYLHVRLNPLVYDWFGTGQDWSAGVARAADEAGGRAFATVFAGPQSWTLGCADQRLDGLDAISVALDWWSGVEDGGFPASAERMGVLRTHVPAPAGVDEVDFYNAPGRYPAEWAALDATFDPVAATADLDARVRQPCLAAESTLSANPYVTRLVSAIDPAEMTVDPLFGFNTDLPEVSNVLQGLWANECNGTGTLTLPGGYELGVADVADADDLSGRPTNAWLAANAEPAALVIEQLSESGPGEILVDVRGSFVGDDVGCGCDGTGAGWLAAAPLVALFVRRRRKGDR